MSDTNFGTFVELMDITGPEIRPLASRLSEIIFDVDPKSVEVVRLGERAAIYGVGPTKMSEGYVYILPHKNWVNLGFFKGAGLPDPASLMEGSGKKLRHIKVRSAEDAQRPELRALIENAAAERRQALEH